MKKRFFSTGKLPLELLENLIKEFHGAEDSSVIAGASIGIDAAIIDLGASDYLIAKTDPITFVTGRVGQYAITVNSNDIACMGGRPRWFLTTLLLPENRTDENLVREIFSELSTACKRLGITICGGHTEITYGLDRPIVVGQMLGTLKRGRTLRPENIRAGDVLILTKAVAIEGTAIIAQERTEEVKRVFGEQFLKRCLDFLDDPGISVLKEAQIICQHEGVRALHDPTEGGLATAVYEMARPTGLGVEIYYESIKIYEETRRLCSHFNLDPLGVISSGALLAAVDAGSEERILKSLRSEGIEASRIGLFNDRKGELTLIKNSHKTPLERFDRDEITKLF